MIHTVLLLLAVFCFFAGAIKAPYVDWLSAGLGFATLSLLT